MDWFLFSLCQNGSLGRAGTLLWSQYVSYLTSYLPLKLVCSKVHVVMCKRVPTCELRLLVHGKQVTVPYEVAEVLAMAFRSTGVCDSTLHSRLRVVKWTTEQPSLDLSGQVLLRCITGHLHIGNYGQHWDRSRKRPLAYIQFIVRYFSTPARQWF